MTSQTQQSTGNKVSTNVNEFESGNRNWAKAMGKYVSQGLLVQYALQRSV
jgi:hypothetical protein